jgi:NAD(P)-dependent dehydrogenase (short-subunit alcohol dehydrogenase family)
MHQPIDDFRHQIEVNLIGAVIVSQAFLPSLGTDRSLNGKPGRMINISSVSGRRGAPFVGAYVASKHALEGLSEVLRRELMLYGIDVIIIGPGAVATPIWDKAEKEDISIYKHTEYAGSALKFQKYMVESGKQGYPPEKVGEVVRYALTTPRPRVRYAVVPNALSGWFIPMLLPKRLVDAMIARRLGFKNQK